MRIKGAAVVVTGAAGGIGRAVAVELAGRKAGHLALVDYSDSVMETAMAANDIAGESVCIGYNGDLRDASFRSTVYKELTKLHGQVDYFVGAPACIPDNLDGPPATQSQRSSIHSFDMFCRAVEVNLIAPLHWALDMVQTISSNRNSQALRPRQPGDPPEGVAVFIGSVSAQGNNGQVTHAATKAGLKGIAADLLAEAAVNGVRCGVIYPAYVESPLIGALGEEHVDRYIIPGTHTRRLIQPGEIAEAVCLIISTVELVKPAGAVGECNEGSLP